MWTFRRRFWNFVIIQKYKANKPRETPIPGDDPAKLETVPLAQHCRGIDIPNIRVAATIPPDEAKRFNLLFCAVLAELGGVFSQNQPNLISIDSNMDEVLKRALTASHRRWFGAPVRPKELEGAPNLGFLAVAGPYFCFLERAPEGGFQWDLRHLDRYEVHPGLRPLGVRVLFAVDQISNTLKAVEIESDLGTVKSGDDGWDQAQKLALCAATTFLSCITHFNNIHLAVMAQFAVATRNNLPGIHPLRRLLWPHLWGTAYSNELVTRVMLMKNGDFEGIFSFTHLGLSALFNEWYGRYDIRSMDPEVDARRREVPIGEFGLPALDNRLDHLQVMRDHTQHYLDIYYPSDDALRADHRVAAWVDELERRVPGGVRPLLGAPLTVEGLARFVAAFIYMGTVEHQILGSAMWNYQLWSDVQPVRVYRDGRRVPVDVYQRLVNYNFLLNVRRESLLTDFSRLAIDTRGADSFRRFQRELRALQAKLALQEVAFWKMYPNILESSVNG